MPDELFMINGIFFIVNLNIVVYQRAVRGIVFEEIHPTLYICGAARIDCNNFYIAFAFFQYHSMSNPTYSSISIDCYSNHNSLLVILSPAEGGAKDLI